MCGLGSGQRVTVTVIDFSTIIPYTKGIASSDAWQYTQTHHVNRKYTECRHTSTTYNPREVQCVYGSLCVLEEDEDEQRSQQIKLTQQIND